MSGSALERLRGAVGPAYRGLRRVAGRIRRSIKGPPKPDASPITVQVPAADSSQVPAADSPQVPVADPSIALFKQAHDLSASGQYEKAIEVLDGILQTRPEDLVILQTKGQLLTALQRHSDAVALFEKALKFDQNNLVTLESLARLYEALKRSDNALDAWRKIALLNGCDENVARMIGNQIWERDERARNSSFFTDVEEGVPPIETIVAEVDEVLKGDSQTNSKILVGTLEKVARQIAGQNSALGRLDTMYTYYEYTLMQGRFRSMALHRYKKTPFQHPESPAPSIPASMLADFSMNGRVEIQSGYTNSALPPACADGFDDEAVKSFLSYNLTGLPPDAQAKAAEIVKGFEPIQHSQAKRTFLRTVEPGQRYELKPKVPPIPYKLNPSKTVAIVGEADHYLECLLIAMCERLTVVRYGDAVGGASLFDEVSLSDWRASSQKFDTIICRRSLEHWGLGRYGEPLDAFGDQSLMKAFREKLQPSGDLFLELPVGRDRLVFNSTRIFGEHRLPRLLQGWRHGGRDPVSRSQLASRVPARVKFHLNPLA